MASFVRGTPQSTVNQYYQNNPWDARGTPTISSQPRGAMGQAQPTPTPSQGTPYGAPDMSAYKPFTSTTTDWMGNTYSSPQAASNQQGAAAWAMNQQRGQQIGDMYSRGTAPSPLDFNAAYKSGQQMLEDGWQNPFLERLLPQAPPTQYRPQPDNPPTQQRPSGGGAIHGDFERTGGPARAVMHDYINEFTGEHISMPADYSPRPGSGWSHAARAFAAPTPSRPQPQNPSPPTQFPVGPGLRAYPRDEARRQERLRQEEAARAQEEKTRRIEAERRKRLRDWDEFDRRAEAQSWIGVNLHPALWAGHPTGATKQNPARGQTDLQRRNAAAADRRWRQRRLR